MARFCGNCGAQIDENAKVCGQCGTPVEDSTKMPPVKVVDSEKKKKNKKIFKAMIALALVAVVAVTAINVVSKFTGYNGLLRKVMTAYEGYDIDTLVSLSSDIYYYGEEDYVESYFENSVGSALDSFETSVGHSYQFSYEVNETYTMSERKTKEVLDGIEYTYADFDVSIIEEMVVSDITVTAKQGSKSVERDLNITMSKENGTWKLLYIEQSMFRVIDILTSYNAQAKGDQP